MTLTPVIEMHVEAETEDCICTKLSGCGGIKLVKTACPEHGVPAVMAPYHTHAKQIRKINRGRWVP